MGPSTGLDSTIKRFPGRNPLEGVCAKIETVSGDDVQMLGAGGISGLSIFGVHRSTLGPALYKSSGNHSIVHTLYNIVIKKPKCGFDSILFVKINIVQSSIELPNESPGHWVDEF